MKIQCDVCEKDEAMVFCTADEAALCALCDHRVHHANKLASKHLRFSLLHPSPHQAPLCDICRERRAFLFCQQDRAILCRECDHPIHSANELTQKHDRFLLSGIKLSATSALYSPSHDLPPPAKNSPAAPCTPAVRKNAPPTATVSPAPDKGGENMTPSSISEYLMETLPGWHFEDFLDSSAFSKSDDQIGMLFRGDGNIGAVPPENLELWVPQGLPAPACCSEMMNGANGIKERKEVGVNSKVNRMWRDDVFTVPQMSPPLSGSFKRCRTFR